MSQTTPITPALVKELRDRTGVGMAKCKEALEQSQGSIENAIDLLRKQGMASAVKKEGRETKEGAIVFYSAPDAVAICEINAETDFVAKNSQFLEFANNIAKEIAMTKPASLEAFVQQPYSQDPKISIDQYRALIIQRIGENIQIRRFTLVPKTAETSVGIYSHMNGKILTTVSINAPELDTIAKEVAMHVAAAAPEYLKPEAIPAEVVRREREIAQDQVKGKPAHIMDKILDGKINAYYDQVCLTRQKFIKDDSLSVEQFIAQSGGKNAAATAFIRWAVGQ